MSFHPKSQRTAALAMIVVIGVWAYGWVVMKQVTPYIGPFDFVALRFALAESLGKLALADPGASAAVVEALDPAVREDYRRDAAWLRRNRSRFSEVQGRAYDHYLRAQGQRDGVRCYGRVVDLLLVERRLRTTGALPEVLR